MKFLLENFENVDRKQFFKFNHKTVIKRADTNDVIKNLVLIKCV